MSAIALRFNRFTNIVFNNTLLPFTLFGRFVSSGVTRESRSKRRTNISDFMAQVLSPKSTVPGSISLHLLGNGGKGNPRSLYLCTDNQRYLFNCGEGSQRLAQEHKMKLSRMENIFITRSTWDNLGGLPGLSMTLQGIGLERLQVHGPSDLVELYKMTKVFGVSANLQVVQHDYDESNYKDSTMEVKRFVLTADSCKVGDSSSKKQKVNKNYVYCYVCKFHDKPGELLINKCIELKVPRGPLLGKLKEGEDVTLPDGRTIFSKDVVGEAEKGPVVFVIDCPSSSYVDSLLHCGIDKEVESIAENSVTAVVHFTPLDVLENEKYESFMSSLSKTTVQMYINENGSRLGHIGTCELQSKLNLVDPKLFPDLKHLSISNSNNSESSDYDELRKTGSSFVLRPLSRVGVDTRYTAKLDTEAVIKEVIKNEELTAAINEYQKECDILKTDSSQFPEIIFLGTGSASPSKHRNTSAILLKVDNDTSFLLDCGEGTYGQLFRFFGDETESELKKLKGIYVSHHHADHHLGIIEILRNRQHLKVTPLNLIVPEAVSSWLRHYSNSYEEIQYLYNVYLSTDFRTPNSCSRLMNQLKINQLVTVKVPHCRDSLGIVFETLNPKYKIVYSGDAMPSKSLIREGHDCDLLIHEATMEDDMLEEAIAKRHSTVSQAIEVGKQMKASTILLTHFSQRYCKIPILDNDEEMRNVGIAYDNMRVKLSELRKLPLLIKPLMVLFAEDYEDLLSKSNQRLKKKAFYQQFV